MMLIHILDLSCDNCQTSSSYPTKRREVYFEGQKTIVDDENLEGLKFLAERDMKSLHKVLHSFELYSF